MIIVLVLGIMLSNALSKDWAILFGNFAYFPVGGFLIFVSFWTLRHFGRDGWHGMAWIAFAGLIHVSGGSTSHTMMHSSCDVGYAIIRSGDISKINGWYS
ncbi:MAG: hypothetical protein OEY10_01600 [Nitrosopumilus sp.]|nr:hypothetical protein [Nitrosopumilus sp.]